MENCRVQREAVEFFYECMYFNGGGYSHNIGYIAPPNETATVAVADNHDSQNSYYMYAHQNIPKLDEDSYDVGYEYDGQIGSFNDAFADEYNLDFYY